MNYEFKEKTTFGLIDQIKGLKFAEQKNIQQPKFDSIELPPDLKKVDQYNR